MIELQLTPEQFAALGLPAEGVTAETFAAALDALIAKLPTAESATAQEATAAQLTALQAELQTFRDAAAAQQQAALDAELAAYDLDEAAVGVLRALPAEQRTALIPKLAKKAAPTPEAKPEAKPAAPSPEGEPPAPVHAPGADDSAASEAEIVAAIKARVAELQKADPRAGYSALWTKAEAELRQKA